MGSSSPDPSPNARSATRAERATIVDKRTSAIHALCCLCGTLRTVSRNATGTELPDTVAMEGYDTEHLAELQSRGFLPNAEPFWRCLIGLKCATCGAITRHAYLRTGQYRNTAEEKDREQDRARRRVRWILAGLEAEGVADVRWHRVDQMTHVTHPVEVHQYVGQTQLLVKVAKDAPPKAQLAALERAMRVLEEPDRIGDWSDDGDWRGTCFSGRVH